MAPTTIAVLEEFLQQHRPRHIVEVGPDPILELARVAAGHGGTVTAVALEPDVRRASGWYDRVRDDYPNISLVAGNALRLSSIVPHADLIVMQNVLLDPTGKETERMWRYRRGEESYTKKDWDDLVSALLAAEHDGLREFLTVAKPGHILTFTWPSVRYEETIAELCIPPHRVRTQQCCPTNDERIQWVAHLIENPAG